ncbi:hypothetical protein [Clostridium sp. KNHs214]|uniref:hypothetical protein n=1 Tax=Clostridium sp. KNHs214 TaxID=1540257 RepID=UPI00054D1E22|nr:hypothetical protein [Clostridium sp. KNHs214]
MNNNRDKMVSEETTRSHSNIVSMTGNVLKPSKASKERNKIESNKTVKEKIISGIIALVLIAGSIGVFVLILK